MTDLHTHNILVIEDNIAHARLIIRSLERAQKNISIVHLDDGEKALDYLEQAGPYADPTSPPPRPDLILLDLKLPKVNGHAVLYNLKTKEDLKSIPVVVLTTSDADTDVSTAYESRANSYLTKPADFDEFTTMIQGVAQYWLNDNTRSVTEVLT